MFGFGLSGLSFKAACTHVYEGLSGEPRLRLILQLSFGSGRLVGTTAQGACGFGGFGGRCWIYKV